jgi:hypothetical protein
MGMTTGLTSGRSRRNTTSRRWRTTLIDPPVEPADPPMNMSAKSARRSTAGQSAKSALAIPVVVMIEIVWKKPARIASSPSAIPYPQIMIVTATDAAKATAM